MIPGNTRRTALTAGLAAAALVMSGCGAAQEGDSGGKLTVVASTSVWGSVARAVGGDDVEVESIVTDPSADPHSYESTPRDAAKIHDADLVLYNGGGYDEFVEQILASEPDKPTVRAVEGEDSHGDHEHGDHEHGDHEHGDHEQGGHSHGEHSHGSHEHGGQHGGHEHGEHSHGSHEHGDHSHEGHEHGSHEHGNEHVWYDLHVVQETAHRLAGELQRLRPGPDFGGAAQRFGAEVDGLRARVDGIADRHGGSSVIVTEPVAHYLIEQAGLRDVTPPDFVHAVEAENDPSAVAVARIQDAVRARRAAAVIYNPQTESPVTERVRTTAEDSGVPVVELTETPPRDASYVRWMGDQIDDLDRALNGA